MNVEKDFIKFDSVQISQQDEVKVEFFENNVLVLTVRSGCHTFQNMKFPLSGLINTVQKTSI